MTIAATRMYRYLSDFVSGITNMYVSLPRSFLTCSFRTFVDNYSASDNVPKGNSSLQKLHWNQTPFNRIEVTVDTSYEEYQAPQLSSGHHSS